MKINTDIIFENLSKTMDVKKFGPEAKCLTIKRIEFFEPDKPLRQSSIYVARASMLSGLSSSLEGMSFICVGGRPPQRQLNERCPLILLEANGDMLSVFNAVQDIFARYEAWEEKLNDILNTSASLHDMVQATIPIMGNPITIYDHNLIMLVDTAIDSVNGYEVESFAVRSIDSPAPLNESMKFKGRMQTDRKRHEPFFVDENMYCLNIHLQNRYMGTITLASRVRKFRQSDFAIFDFFTRYILESFRKCSKILNTKVVNLKTIFKDLLDCYPVHESRIEQVSSGNPNGSFVCFKLKLVEDSHSLPVEYICLTIENLLPGSMAMEHESVIVACICFDNCPYSFEDCLTILNKFLEETNLQAGISNRFTDFLNARAYFRQACCALETGYALHPEKRQFLFSDYTLAYMLKNSIGELREEYILPKGLMRLREHDSASAVNYWETLRVYLNNGMNAAQTAKDLYLHRSTLLKRLTHIYSVLDMDINDPKQRLYLQMCICICELNESP